ncbi:MAG: nicotinamide-nucleotide adenylyltransferase [Candidatus Thorarchaeota archaeon]
MRSVFIGRFQPIHRGHVHTMQQILEKGEDLIVVVGSAQYSHTPDNPFTAGERLMMIKRVVIDEGMPLERIDIIPLPDINIHPLWVAHLKSHVPYFDKAYSHNPLVRKLLQDAGIPVDDTRLLSRTNYSGSHIRDLIRWGGEWEPLVPPGVAEIIKKHGLDERIRSVGETTTKR